MALKHLLLAAELMRGGMPLSEISEIIKMQDVPTPEDDPNQQQDDPASNQPDDPNQQQDDPASNQPDDPNQQQDDPAPAQGQPAPAPEPEQPLNRPELNRSGGQNLIDELNKLF